MTTASLRLRHTCIKWTVGVCSLAIAAPAHAGPPRVEPTCETTIRISGAVYNARAPERSWAVAYPEPGKRGGVYRRGMYIDAFRLVAIEPRGLLLERAGQHCWLRLSPELDGKQRAAKAERPKKRKRRPRRSRRPAFSKAELERGVQAVGPGTYIVQRSLLREAVGRARRIARSTRVRYVGPRKKPRGLMLRSIANDGLLEALGLKRRDVLKTVNGFSLVTPDGMLGAQSLVQQADRLSLILERNGKPVSIEYRLN